MAVKYVFVTGGVVSGLGKGITAASLGRLLKARGYKVTMQKFDPYINVDPGTMNPIQHGEVFVTDDGTETDLDLGHYERFIDESLDKNSNVTTGKVYWSVLQKERHGDFGGVLLIVSAVPTFYELYKDMTTVFSVGYGNTLGNATGIDKIFVLISGFYISAVLILYCFEEKKRYIVYLALGLYSIMQLLGGSRISVFRLAIVLLIISNLLRKEINKKRLVWIFLFGLIGVFAFSFVSSARNYIYLADDVQLFFKKTAGDLWENNFIISAIKEMGNTQVINTLVYSLCPSKVEYRYGLSFVRSIYSIFPNVFNLKYISIDEIFSGFYTVTNAGCGASFIAEGYWNFGYFSAFFFLALGYIWAVLADRFKRICNEEYVNPEKAFLIVYLMYFMIFLVRSESIELGRSFVYYALVPILMSKTLHSNRGG